MPRPSAAGLTVLRRRDVGSLDVTAVRGPLRLERRARCDKGGFLGRGLVGRILLGEELLGGGARDLAGAPLVEVEAEADAQGSEKEQEDAEHDRAAPEREPGDAFQRSDRPRAVCRSPFYLHFL